MVLDLNNKLPFKDESVDGVIASHVLEHLSYFNFMSELSRILAPGGRVYFLVPYFTNHRAHIGEHVVPGFSWVAFEHFKDPNHPFYSFKIISNRIRFGNRLGFLDNIVARFSMIYDRFFCYIMPATELEVVLEKRSGKHDFQVKNDAKHISN